MGADLLVPGAMNEQPQPRTRRSLRLRTFRRIMTWMLAAGVLAFLVIPMIITFESSGTQTYREAAGPSAEFISVGGLDVHIETAKYSGDCACTPPLFVLLHGFGASTFSWREVIEPLSAQGDVLAYDRPGFGFTERPTSWGDVNPYSTAGNLALLERVIERFGQNREVVLIGHSAGGQLAALLAERNPNSVQRLVLVDPAIITAGGVPAFARWMLDIPQVDRLGPFLVKSLNGALEQILYSSFYNQSKVTDEVLVGYKAPTDVIDWERAFWQFMKAPRVELSLDDLASLKQPTLVISGSKDTIVPLTDTKQVASAIPESTLVVINQSGHLPHEEQPGVFLHSLTAWLSETALQ